MTRGNLSFFARPGDCLYHYHNGDQYPAGLLSFFHVDKLLDDLTEEGFRKWLRSEYTNDFPRGTRIPKLSHPAIYYAPGGWPTDWSYVFSPDTILVYHWCDCVFHGSPKEFREWLVKQD